MRKPTVRLQGLVRRVRTWSIAGATVALAACGTLAPPADGAGPADVQIRAAASEPVPVTREAAPAIDPSPSISAPPPKRAAPPADARPRVERIAAGHPNQPYEIRGVRYVPHNTDLPMSEIGLGSWYGEPFHGRAAATGERYDMDAMTAAHPTMPLPSYARVRNLRNGREVIVRVNDRGPFVGGRIIDLSRAAARRLGFSGLAMLEVTRLTHDDIRSGAWRARAMPIAATATPVARKTAAVAQASPGEGAVAAR